MGIFLSASLYSNPFNAFQTKNVMVLFLMVPVTALASDAVLTEEKRSDAVSARELQDNGAAVALCCQWTQAAAAHARQ